MVAGHFPLGSHHSGDGYLAGAVGKLSLRLTKVHQAARLKMAIPQSSKLPMMCRLKIVAICLGNAKNTIMR
jgi:hypothetical protein